MTAPRIPSPELLPADVQVRADQEFGSALRRAIAAMPAGWSGPALAVGPFMCRAAVSPPQTAMSFLMLESPISVEASTAPAALDALAAALEERRAGSS